MSARPSPSGKPDEEADLGAPIGLALLGLFLAAVGIAVGAASTWQVPLFIAALACVSVAGMGFFFELAKGNSRESYNDFGTVFALFGVAALLVVLTKVYDYSSTITTVMSVAALAAGGFAVIGLGIGIQRLLKECPDPPRPIGEVRSPEKGRSSGVDSRTQRASRPAKRTLMTRYELLSLIQLTVFGVLTFAATILAAYIQKS